MRSSIDFHYGHGILKHFGADESMSPKIPNVSKDRSGTRYSFDSTKQPEEPRTHVTVKSEKLAQTQNKKQ